jgi:hypothetical protein
LSGINVGLDVPPRQEGKLSSHVRANARKCRCIEEKKEKGAGILQSVLVVKIDSFRTL